MNIRKQLPKDGIWHEESGTNVPYSRTTPYERRCEKEVYAIARDALALHKKLHEFKEQVRAIAQSLYEEFAAENGGTIGKGKGNATFYNFNRSIKIEINVNEMIRFDENTIELAKSKLMDFIGASISTEDDFIKELVLSAFETSRGRLDTNKILGLKKHAARIKDKRYHEAMALIDKSISRPSSREYTRVAVKDDSGQYKYIDLNFSSI